MRQNLHMRQSSGTHFGTLSTASKPSSFTRRFSSVFGPTLRESWCPFAATRGVGLVDWCLAGIMAEKVLC